MTDIRYILCGLLMIAILGATTMPAAAADEPTGAPAAEAPAQAKDKPEPAKPADVQGAQLATNIVAVKGLVQVRQGEDQPWKPAKAGMKLNPGAEFRTGPRSSVQFKVGDTQTITLDRLGVIKVVDAIRAEGKITTDLGMKYGRTELQVEAGGVEHESRIHSPSSTLAVRGSAGVLQSDSFTSVAYCTEDEASVDMYDRRGRIVHIEMPEPVITDQKHGDPIKTAMMSDAYNPFAFGSTPEERELFADYPDGKFLYDSFLGPGNTEAGRGNATAWSQMDTVYHDLSGDNPPPMGMFTGGVLNVSMAFESTNAEIPSDLNLSLNIPGQGIFSVMMADPNGVFMHSGDEFSAASGDIAGEAISGTSMTLLPVGSYTAILQNAGSADASVLTFQAQAATGGGANQVLAQQAGVIVPNGGSVNIPFNVPAQTAGAVGSPVPQ